MNTRMRIIITGGSGFIGSNVLEYFLRKDFEILNIDFSEPKNHHFNKYWSNIDIRDYETLKKAVLSFSPDFVIHLAARTDLDGKHINDYTSNTLGTENLVNICNEIPNLKRVIFTSSMLVCKAGYIPKNQLDFNPTTVYGESKMLMEKLIRDANPKYEWLIIRPTSIWGPGFKIPYKNFFDMIINRRYFHIGGGLCTKTYGYIGNVIYQIDSLLNSPIRTVNRRIFYIGDYEPINIKIWANEIAKELRIKIYSIPYPLIKMAAWLGDLLTMLSIDFPMTSFRLKNMTTDNIVDLSNTMEIAPQLPYSRVEGIKNTLEWLKHNK